MKLVFGRDIRVEMFDGAAIVLDRSGKAVHHVAGEGFEALHLVSQGIDERSVPDHLAPAMTMLVDAGVVVTPDWSRRKLLRAAGASVAGAALVTVALASPAAARSGTSTVDVVKSVNNNDNPSLTTLCLGGGQGNSKRGISTFTRTEGPATISVTITMTTGTSAVGRTVYILQSSSPTSCVGGTVSPAGIWSPSFPLGPQTFSAPIVAGATRFVVALQLSGGGGVDGWSSLPVTLP